MLSNYYSDFVEKNSRAGILEGNIITDVAIMAFKLKQKHPEVAIQIIETFGNAGEILVKDRDFFTKEKREYILWEIDRRIDQIKPSAFDKKLNAKVTKTVNIAKQKIKAE